MTITIHRPPDYPVYDSPDEELAERLKRIPEKAGCRGFYVNMLDRVAGQLGPEVQTSYRENFPMFKVPIIRMHPIADYIRRAYFIAREHRGLDEVYDGITTIQGHAYQAFFNNLVGRQIQRLFSPTPRGLEKLCKWMNFNRQILLNYGKWTFTKRGNESLLIDFDQEYVYIEYAMVGGFLSLAESFSLKPSFNVQLRDQFNGSIEVTWPIIQGDSNGC